MQTELYVPDYIRPLIAYEKTSAGAYSKSRFVGTCFFIDNKGSVLTCAHIIEDLNEKEKLFSFDIRNNKPVPIKVVYKHETADFVICQLFNTTSKFFTLGHGQVMLARDVASYGYLNNGVSDGVINIDYRVMKGHVSRVDSQGSRRFRSNKIIEVSYPSLAGFSGAPIFDTDNLELVGMLFGNVESSIEVFSVSEMSEEGNEKYAEKIHRIIEYGIGHSIDTIVRYLEEGASNNSNFSVFSSNNKLGDFITN